jgi:hypothetical protein
VQAKPHSFLLVLDHDHRQLFPAKFFGYSQKLDAVYNLKRPVHPTSHNRESAFRPAHFSFQPLLAVRRQNADVPIAGL